MRRKRLLITLSVVLGIAVAVALAVVLRKAAPPEPIRLLPGAQAYLFVNLKPLRMAKLLENMPAVQFDAEYDQFVRETGFQFERDLDQAAIAVHAPPPSAVGAKPDPAAENRFSEVFEAHFNAEKVQGYLAKLASTQDDYRGLKIFDIPHENRTVRVCLLGPDLVAVSNVDDPRVIRGIVDRYKKLASPFGGPMLIRRYYRKLPLGSLAWAIADVSHGSPQNKAVLLPGGFDLFFPPDTTVLASIRYLGSIDVKAEALTTTEEAARRISDQMNAFLGIFRTLELSASGSDADVKTFFESIRIEQDGPKAVLTAELPKGFLKKVFTEPPPEIQPAAPAPEQPKTKPKTPRKKR